MAIKVLEPCKTVTASDLELQSTAGFIKRFWQHLQTSRTQEEAYSKVATDFRLIFNCEKFTSYNSFRVVKNRIIKTK